MQDVGRRRVVELARAMGVDHSKLDAGALARARHEPGDAARDGQRLRHDRAPRASTASRSWSQRIVDRHGTVLAEFGDGAASARCRAETAVELVDMMRGVVSRGTGTAIRRPLRHHGRRRRQDRHHAEQHRRLVHPDAPAAWWPAPGSASTTSASRCAATTGARAATTRSCWSAATSDGGAIFLEEAGCSGCTGSGTFNGYALLMQGNSATDKGGAIASLGGSGSGLISMDRSLIRDNTATANSGVAFVDGSVDGTVLELRDTTLTGNGGVFFSLNTRLGVRFFTATRSSTPGNSTAGRRTCSSPTRSSAASRVRAAG